MFAQPRRLSSEARAVFALAAAIGIFFTATVAGVFNVGVYGCPTCTTSDNGRQTSCNGNEPTYCGGGLLALGVSIYLLSTLSFLFAWNWMLASRRPWETSQGAWRARRSLETPVVNRFLALTLLANGGGLIWLGLWTTPNFCLPIEGPCGILRYVLTGVPLILVLVGWAAFALGIAFYLPGLIRAFREPRAGAAAP